MEEELLPPPPRRQVESSEDLLPPPPKKKLNSFINSPAISNVASGESELPNEQGIEQIAPKRNRGSEFAQSEFGNVNPAGYLLNEEGRRDYSPPENPLAVIKPKKRVDQNILNKVVKEHVENISAGRLQEYTTDKFFQNLEKNGYSPEQLVAAKKYAREYGFKANSAEEVAQEKEREEKRNESYVGGALRAFNEGFANNILTPLDGAAKLIADVTGLESGGGFANAAENIKINTEENTGRMPEGLAGDVVSGVASTVPLIASLVVTPEIKLANLGKATNGILTSVPKLSTNLAATGFLGEYSRTQEFDSSLFAAGKGAVEGAVLHGLGVYAQGFGNMVKEAGAGNITSKSAAALFNGLGFGGYDAAQQYAETGSVDTKRVLSSIGTGVALSAGDLAGAMFEKAKENAVTNYFTTPSDQVREVVNTENSAQNLRQRAQKVGEAAIDEKNPAKKEALLKAQQGLNSAADIKAMNDAVSEKPQEYIDAIEKDETLTSEEKQSYVEKINASVDNTATKVSEERDNVQGISDVEAMENPGTREFYDKVIEANGSPGVVERVAKGLNVLVEDGQLTEEQAKERMAEFERVVKIDQSIPKYIKTADNRFEASKLIEEKNNLQEQAKGLDQTLSIPLKDRIAEIDESLISIANKEGAGIPIKEKGEGVPKTSNTDVIKTPPAAEQVAARGVEGTPSATPEITANPEALNEGNINTVPNETEIQSSTEAPAETGTQNENGWQGEEGLLIPPVEPSPVSEVTSPEPKKLKLGERVLSSQEVSPEIKKGLQEEGIDYVPVNLEVTQKEAREYVTAFDDAGEIDKAISNVTNTSNGMSGVNRGAIGKELFETLADKAKAAETIEEQKKWQNKAVEIAKFTADNFRKAGQEINAAKAWKRMLERTPEGVVTSIKKTYSEQNEPVLKANAEEIKGAKKIIDDFLKSKNFESLVGEKVKTELDKLNKRAPKRESIFNSKEVREKRKRELKERWKTASNSGLSSSIAGLNKEQIEIAGEYGVIALLDGAYTFKKWVRLMKKEFNELTESQLNYLWEKTKVPKEYDERQRTLDEFAKYGVFDKLSPAEKKGFLDKWDKRLSKLKPENRKKLLGNVIDEIEKLGGMSDERFRELYAKELGLSVLDPATEGKILNLVETINKSDKIGRELSDLYDSKADKKIIQEKAKEWSKSIYEGQKANNELSQYFKSDKKIGTTLSTILQGNLLGTLSVIKNIYSNALIQPTRMLSRGIASSGDYVLSKAAQMPFLGKYVSDGRTIDALSYWKGASKGVLPGLITSAKELIHGINPEEMIERDLNQQLQPLRSMVKLYEGLTGKEKQTKYQQINNFTEATFGMPAEVMFRLLNLGDKPFRKAAEMGAAYEIGTLKGLKGAELDKFVLFPDAESAESIKSQGEYATYQQSDGLSKAAQAASRKIEEYLGEKRYIGEIVRVLYKTNIPYIKTPLNILTETIELALPEYSILRSVDYAMQRNRKEALNYMGKAVTGALIRSGAQILVSSGLVTPSTDQKDRKGTQIQYQNVPPNSLNVTGLQRMLSGGVAKPKDGDLWINYANSGVVGMLISLQANNKKFNPAEQGYFEELFSLAASLPKEAIEQSFLQGTNRLITAWSNGGPLMDKWLIGTGSALGAIFYPNTLSTISRASDDYVRETRDINNANTFINTWQAKMFQSGELPTKVNLWGEKVKSVPDGANKYLYYLLDVTKAKRVPTNSFNYKIYDLWSKESDETTRAKILPSIPANYISYKNSKIRLSPQQYETLQIYIGRNRASLVRQYVGSVQWDNDSQEEKIKQLRQLYKDGYDNGKSRFLFENSDLKHQSGTTPSRYQ